MCEERDVKWDAIEKEMEQLVLVRVIFFKTLHVCVQLRVPGIMTVEFYRLYIVISIL